MINTWQTVQRDDFKSLELKCGEDVEDIGYFMVAINVILMK